MLKACLCAALLASALLAPAASAQDAYGRTGRMFTAAPRNTDASYVRIMRRYRPYDWTGLYFGANLGGLSSTAAFDWVPDPAGFPNAAADLTTASTGSSSNWALIGGGEIGANWQVDNHYVVGIEADYGVLRLKQSRADNLARFGFASSPLAESMDLDGIATVRGRLGYAFDRLLIYATGGVAFAHFKYRDSIAFGASGTNNTASLDTWSTAAVYGGGIEYALAGNWTAKIGYLHTEIGDPTSSRNSDPVAFPAAGIVHNHNARIDIVRFGLDYKFGGN